MRNSQRYSKVSTAWTRREAAQTEGQDWVWRLPAGHSGSITVESAVNKGVPRTDTDHLPACVLNGE
jgi:hypothetical protein